MTGGFRTHRFIDEAALREREADALAAMMGADSRRIDGLVGDVGEVKGDVRALRADMGRVSEGVDELRGAMTILARHSVMMETTTTDVASLRANVEKIDGRVQTIERDMPGLQEMRAWAIRAMLGTLVMVGAAVVALVVHK